MLENPALPSLPRATCKLSPTTAGTSDPPGETKIVTVLPNLTEVPGDGSCRTTVLAGAVELGAVCSWTWKPLDLSRFSASATDLCLTFGTSTIFGPLDAKIVTVVPAATTLPFAGLVLITMSLGMVELDCFCTVYFSPACVISCSACVSVCPSTCGTA